MKKETFIQLLNENKISENDVTIRVHFILNEEEYFYLFRDKKGASRIVHTPLHYAVEACPFCYRNKGRCYDLIDSMKEEVLSLVLNHHSVRLRLLALGFAKRSFLNNSKLLTNGGEKNEEGLCLFNSFNIGSVRL